MTRRESREQAFLLVFEKSFGEDSVEEILEAAGEARNVRPSAFSRELFEGVTRELPHLDEQITHYAEKWNTNRLSRVALSLLRLAIYEMQFVEDTPQAVAINEAVELAKKYGNEDEAAFINGVLGGVARQTKQGETP